MRFTTLLAAILSAASSLTADIVLFNNAVDHGIIWTNAPDTIGIDTSFKYPKTDTDTIKLVMTGDYRSGGLALWGEEKALLIPVDESTLQVAVYTPSPDALNDFQIDTTTGTLSFNNTEGSWTLDGIKGLNTDLTANTWHVLRFDLTSIPSFEPGITQLNGQVAFKTKESDATVYFGDIRLTSDEYSE